jgi:septum formation protein
MMMTTTTTDSDANSSTTGVAAARPDTVSSSSTSAPSLSSSSSSQQQQQPRLVLSLRDRLKTIKTNNNTDTTISSSSNTNNGDDFFVKIELVLASQSPRRREILDMMGLQGLYRVQPSPLDETSFQIELLSSSSSSSLSPVAYTKRLAEAKAEALAYAEQSQQQLSQDDSNEDRFHHHVLYLGSDTIVEIDDKILEKPKDEDDARHMLQIMSGREHHVHTGVALYCLRRRRRRGRGCTSSHDNDENQVISLLTSFVETSTVKFATLTDDDIQHYIETGDPMDKAGSYGIQGIGGQFVQNITGDFFTVMGLPMHRTSQAIADAILLLLEKEAE